jgi:hypothetical protein
VLQRFYMDAKKHIHWGLVAAAILALPLFSAAHKTAPSKAEAAITPRAVTVQTTPPASTSTSSAIKEVQPAVSPTPKTQAREITPPLDRMRITSHFGIRNHPILDRQIPHHGVDLAANLNDPVRNVYDGIVTSAGVRGGYGNAVEVYHPILKKSTIYAHLNEIHVANGQRVAEGQVLGLAGSTGLSTGVHLHFGVENRAGDYIDPMRFLAGLSDSPASTQIATAPVKHKTSARVIVASAAKRTTSPTTVVARKKSSATPVIASNSASSNRARINSASSNRARINSASSNRARINSASSNRRDETSASESHPLTKQSQKVAIAAKPKPASAPKRDTTEIQNRYEVAAKAAETFSKLYEEGAVSRNQRDEKIAAAKAIQAELK